uniref:Uncharacterized protein n=1 Tax=Peronospora matthiolae TaxID=2874970 RepID=A0AAV1TDW7_9STRA
MLDDVQDIGDVDDLLAGHVSEKKSENCCDRNVTQSVEHVKVMMQEDPLGVEFVFHSTYSMPSARLEFKCPFTLWCHVDGRKCSVTELKAFGGRRRTWPIV